MFKFQAESFKVKPATDFSALYLPLSFGTLEIVKHRGIWSCPTRLPKESLYSLSAALPSAQLLAARLLLAGEAWH